MLLGILKWEDHQKYIVEAMHTIDKFRSNNGLYSDKQGSTNGTPHKTSLAMLAMSYVCMYTPFV